jgi:hypothetical protein
MSWFWLIVTLIVLALLPEKYFGKGGLPSFGTLGLLFVISVLLALFVLALQIFGG